MDVTCELHETTFLSPLKQWSPTGPPRRTEQQGSEPQTLSLSTVSTAIVVATSITQTTFGTRGGHFELSENGVRPANRTRDLKLEAVYGIGAIPQSERFSTPPPLE